MTKKLADFLSSIGMMMFGVGLLFFCSVTMTGSRVQKFVEQLPVHVPQQGGDEMPLVLPVSHPAIPVMKSGGEDYSGNLTAQSAMVVDDQTNTVLFKKNEDAVRSLASITKLMSAIVLSELPINWTSSTVILDEDTDPFSHHLSTGEKYRLDDLWKIALVGSSNSAIKAMVRASGLSEEDFVQKMNDKAVALGLNSLRFVEPTGLNSRNMGKAGGVLKLLKDALKNDRIAEALNMPEYYALPLNGKTKNHIWSTDELLTGWVPSNFDKDVLAGKTGYIDESGYNFVARIPGKKDHVVRVVVLGAATNEARFTEVRDLAKWAFDNYLWPDDEGYASSTAR